MSYNNPSSSIALTGSFSHEGPSRPPLVIDQASSTTPIVRQPTRYETQKQRDWITFGQYLSNYPRPSISISECNYTHVLGFLRYLDQFGKTKVHVQGCTFYGQPDPQAPCPCPLRQAWGSLDSLIGRLRAAYEEHGGAQEANPFANPMIRSYLREVKDCQAKARGVPYKKKKRKKAGEKTADKGQAMKHPRQRRNG
ncbi:hypothetical protein MLD38_021179 [Melastoma candidum]|uniref:Uncharacterized protein n=1 Tax=Melastoma candidum TaxID=119954 RepID=A0ACB9QGI0_9MYRT|nr:hypothetical protein MLD38_021179 [Melastoma candidum]